MSVEPHPKDLPETGDPQPTAEQLDEERRLRAEAAAMRAGAASAHPRNRHPSTQAVVRHFAYDHLPPHLRSVSAECAALADSMLTQLDDSPELTVGLRKLLEAKDCFVRAALDESG